MVACLAHGENVEGRGELELDGEGGERGGGGGGGGGSMEQNA